MKRLITGTEAEKAGMDCDERLLGGALVWEFVGELPEQDVLRLWRVPGYRRACRMLRRSGHRIPQRADLREGRALFDDAATYRPRPGCPPGTSGRDAALIEEFIAYGGRLGDFAIKSTLDRLTEVAFAQLSRDRLVRETIEEAAVCGKFIGYPVRIEQDRIAKVLQDGWETVIGDLGADGRWSGVDLATGPDETVVTFPPDAEKDGSK